METLMVFSSLFGYVAWRGEAWLFCTRFCPCLVADLVGDTTRASRHPQSFRRLSNSYLLAPPTTLGPPGWGAGTLNSPGLGQHHRHLLSFRWMDA